MDVSGEALRSELNVSCEPEFDRDGARESADVEKLSPPLQKKIKRRADACPSEVCPAQ